MKRLRSGELLSVIGAACLIVSLFEPWYEAPTGNLSAWSTFGPALVLLMLDALVALSVVLSAVSARGPASAVFTAVWSVPVGLVGLVAALVRLLERPEHAGGVCAGPWLGLAGALVVLVGGWQTLRDEHTPLYSPATPEPIELDDAAAG